MRAQKNVHSRRAGKDLPTPRWRMTRYIAEVVQQFLRQVCVLALPQPPRIKLTCQLKIQPTTGHSDQSCKLCSGKIQAENIYLLELRQHGKTFEPILGYVLPEKHTCLEGEDKLDGEMTNMPTAEQDLQLLGYMPTPTPSYVLPMGPPAMITGSSSSAAPTPLNSVEFSNPLPDPFAPLMLPDYDCDAYLAFYHRFWSLSTHGSDNINNFN